jgi:hypothetical protein
MNMSVEQHLSGCCDTVCVQHFSIDKKAIISQKVISQSFLVTSIIMPLDTTTSLAFANAINTRKNKDRKTFIF